MYGYTDSNDVGPGKSGGKFGLNIGANITKFEYNPNGGSGGAEQDCIDFTVQIGEKEFRHRYFPVSKVYGKGGGEITDTNSEEYKEGLKKEVSLLNATLSDIVKCFVSEADLKTALATPIASFKDYAQILERLVKSTPNWDKTNVDVFLQYQWQPSGENDKTYLELPKNVKHGTFICRTQGSGYAEDRTPTHLRYVHSESGAVHPFRRNEWFVTSDFAKQTGVGATATPSAAPGTMATSGDQAW